MQSEDQLELSIMKILLSEWSMKYKRSNLLKSNEAGGDEMSSPRFLRVAHFAISAVLLIMIENDE